MKKSGLLILGLIIIDQVVKLFATQLTSPIILTNFFQLNYVKNFGVAWSMLNNKQYIIIIFSSFAIGYLIKLMFEYKEHIIFQYGFSLMIAGALGNFIDRVIHNFVIDYIDINIFGYDFPVFNIADMLLVCGVIVIFLESIRKVKNGETI